MATASPLLSTTCCIVGAGPAGLMLGYLLARAGVDVTVLEKHQDFLRDFRGDTLHPSTLEIMHHLGLLKQLLQLPHQRAEKLGTEVAGREITLADFSQLTTQCKFMAFMPQWDFLNFLAEQAKQYPQFKLITGVQVRALIEQQQQVCGVIADTSQGELLIKADLVVGTDGRNSVVREQAGFVSQSFGAPRDVLWLKLDKRENDPAWSMGHRGPRKNFIMIDRGDYWQCGYSIEKGSFNALQQTDLRAFLQQVAAVAPFEAERWQAISDWSQIKLLSIRIDRLEQWAKPGVLCIGDAAHAMSPIGGVGVNLAIQDAVATANIIAAPLLAHRLDVKHLHQVQKRRQFPTQATQFLQIKMSSRGNKPSNANPGGPPKLVLRLLQSQWLPRLVGRIIGIGFRSEKPGKLYC